MKRGEHPYADPYLAGVALGLVLLASFAITGRGLGASGAFAATAAGLTNAVSPARAAASPLWSRYLAGGGPWREWLLFELVGVVIGGFVSALIAGRLRGTVERGPRISRRARIACAFGGGTLMGFGAILARGCTSGLALTGGALLAVGSWIFIASAFTAAYLFAPLVRKAWR